MDYKLHLANEDMWAVSDETWVRGRGFVDGAFHTTKRLLDRFETVSTVDEFEETVQQTNGFFAIIHRIDDRIYLAVDRIQSIPLFYAVTDGGVAIGSDSHPIANHIDCLGFRFCNEAEYILTGYVAGPETLCEDIYQVQAGEIVSLSGARPEQITRNRYYRYRHSGTHNRSTAELLEELDDVTEAAFERLIEYADGRTLVVNMSGGYDSRLLVSMLSRLGYENVLAFTYEYSGDEKRYCEQIADRLDLDWIYVEQTHGEWKRWYRSPQREELDRKAGILRALPTIGPAIAIKKLDKQDRVPEDAIFVTGDSATTTGDHIPPEVMKRETGSDELLVESVISTHYEFWGMDAELRSTVSRRIREVLGVETCTSREEVAGALELWDWQERQAKHILRTYLFDYWGYDFWYPLWDREFMDYWRTVPLEQRFGRSLYERYVRHVYAEVAGLSTGEAASSFHERNPWVTRIEKVLSGTPLKQPAEQLYRRHISPRTYEDNPIWGIMERAQFDRLHSGRQVIHAFRVLELLGHMSFDPPIDGHIPDEGQITLETLDRPRPARPLTSVPTDK